MTEDFARLNDWHTELAILAGALRYALEGIETPDGLAATTHVLTARLDELVATCPFPEATP